MQRDPIPGAGPTAPTLAERLRGGLWGLLVGDAAGVPYEFHRAEDLPPREGVEMVPPEGFRRAHADTAPGTWSDDGAQALALFASLTERGGFDPDDFARRLSDWYKHGEYAVDRRVFDCGMQTRLALRALAYGVPPLKAGPANEEDNGNGSLMRVLPLALWHRGPDAELVEHAHDQSRITHGHLRAQVCCAVYCLWARQLLQGAPDGWDDAVSMLSRLYYGRPDHLAELEFVTRPEHGRRIRGSGYVLHTLWAARHAMAGESYEDVVKTAICLGEDTDTTACVAGGLAGIRHGVGGIPRRWMDAMRGREIVERLLRALQRFEQGASCG